MKIQYNLLVSFQHIGDYNQAKQVLNHIYWTSKSNQFQFKLNNIQNKQTLLNRFENKHSIIHCFGQKALYKLKQLQILNLKCFQNIFVIVQIHQYFDILQQLKIHYLIIPKSTYKATQKVQKIQKYLMQGTLFQKLNDQNLKQKFQSSLLKQQLPEQNSYIIVMLGGDAPDNHEMNCFTKQSSQILFNILLQFLQKSNNKYKLIIQNGPRTGKHDPETKKQICLHKYNSGQNPQKAIDQISKYFVNLISKQQIDYKFYNFAFQINEQKRNVVSYYKPLLYLAKKNQNIFFFPMESVSMCSQLPYYIKSNNLYAYLTSSTNKSHLQIIENFYNKGLFNKFDLKGNFFKAKNKNQQSRIYDQTQYVIKKINENIQKWKN